MFRKNKSLIKTISLLLLLALGLSFGIYQISQFGSDPIKTQTVLLQSVYKEVDADIFVLRDESYITSNAGGVYVPLLQNGARVAGGDIVSVMMQNEEQALLFSKKKQIETDLAYYKSLSNISVSQTTDISPIDKEISNKVHDYVELINSGRLSKLKIVGGEVRDSITQRQITTGTKFDFSEKIISLENEYQQIISASSDRTDILADKSGYFVSDVDGFENTLPYQNAANLTVEDISSALAAPPAEIPLNVKGKLVGEFDWFLACALDTKNTEDLYVGKTVTIHLPNSAAEDFKASVLKINESSEGKTPVIFKTDIMNESLTGLRKESGKIRVEEHSGYSVDNRAIRMLDGEKGIYIRRGSLISFRKIDVLYSGEDFSIINKENSQLKLYDEAIVEGTDLYDGKIIT